MEIDKRQCKVCGEIKLRIRDGRFPNHKDSKFVDELGKHWNGNTCPKCHNEKIRAQVKAKRQKAKEEQ